MAQKSGATIFGGPLKKKITDPRDPTTGWGILGNQAITAFQGVAAKAKPVPEDPAIQRGKDNTQILGNLGLETVLGDIVKKGGKAKRYPLNQTSNNLLGA